MNSLEYTAAETLDDALSIKNTLGADARVIAGGTDLILRLRDKVFLPKLLLDLRRLGLNRISSVPGELHLGAYLSLAQMLASREIATSFPALVAACRPFAGPPIRNRGTLGGNIVNASPAADLVPPLMAYDATIVLVSSSGCRVLPLAEFFTDPGKTVLQPNEILTQVRLPVPADRTAAVFTKLGQRRSMAISIVNLCTRLTVDTAGVVSAAGIVLGSVAPTALHARRAEAALTGKALSTDSIGQAAKLAGEEVSPISDVRSSKEYRRRMTEVLVRRALVDAWSELETGHSND